MSCSGRTTSSAPTLDSTRAETDGDAAVNLRERAVSPYTTREKVLRLLWNLIGQPVFRLTFHNWYETRARILRLFGARIARDTRIRARITIEQPWNLTMGSNSCIGDRSIVYCLGKITLGDNVSISQGVHLCAGTHDFTKYNLPLLRPPIAIEEHAWVAADAFVGPNVTVGEGAILGARSCAMKDLEPWTIYAGNPARPLRVRSKPEGIPDDLIRRPPERWGE